MSILPSIGQFANFVAWCVYGIVGNEPALLRVNAIGVGFALFYFAVFLTYAVGAHRRNLVAALLGAGLGLSLLFTALIVGPGLATPTRILALGYVAMSANVVMYASPIAAIRNAWTRMDPDALPLLLTTASTLCSISWLAYGLLTSNLFVWAPNAAGVLLSVIQIGLGSYITVVVRADPSLRKRASGGGHSPTPSVDGDVEEDEAGRGRLLPRGTGSYEPDTLA